jgi:hypothetical protein
MDIVSSNFSFYLIVKAMLVTYGAGSLVLITYVSGPQGVQ